MTETIPQLSEQTIRDRFDAQSWQRGRQYARDSAIINARRQGMTLKASCIGSRPEPYRVEVTFNDEEIIAADCSCPVGEEGYCKHAAALLITWLNRPETFREAEETDVILQQRDKNELIALIKQMIRRYPDLETLLDMPLPGMGKAGQPPSPDVLRRQVAAAFQRGGYEWGAEAKITQDLLPLIEIGDEFLQRPNYADATTIYQAISGAMLEDIGSYSDENGYLQGIVGRCMEGMIDALSGLTVDPATRATILPALFAIYRHDIDVGHDYLASEISSTLPELITDEERHTIAGWVRDALPTGNRLTDDYHRRAYGAFLLDLEADELDDEAFLRLCRETSRFSDLVGRLLMLDRVDDAAQETRAVSDYELLRMADLFVEYEQPAVAERLMRERAATSQDNRLTEWLKTFYVQQGDTARALDLAEKLFRTQPRFDLYREMRDLAGKAGTWKSLRKQLIALLTQSSRTPLLISIYLDEGELDHAIDCVLNPPKRTAQIGIAPGYSFMPYGGGTALDVAKAAEAIRPKSARIIYERHAESLIAGRNRESYRQACTYLISVRELYDRVDEFDGWERHLAGLREKYRTLRALKEEMTSAGLLD